MIIFSGTRTTVAAALLAAFSFAALQAHAGLFDDDEARKAILDLRAKVEGIQHGVDELGTKVEAKADKSSTLDLVNQNEQLHQDVAQLRGQVEVLANELGSEQKRQKDFYVDLDNRLRKLEPQKVAIDGKEASVDPAEQKAYDAAQTLLKSGDYKNAGIAFSDFLRAYPDSGYAASAQYLLGIAYYAQRDYKNAVTALQLLLKSYPDNPKAPDALLNLAICYGELKEKPAAKKTLTALIAKYPDTPAAQTAKDRLKALK